MGDRSTIEWTDATWNPTRGCSRVSEGCRLCYAERVASRFSGDGMPYAGFAHNGKWTGKVALVPDKLDQPLRWRRPRRIFVDSMSDLFHESLDFEDVDRVFAVMALAQQHTFQVLTKRPVRMVEYVDAVVREKRSFWRHCSTLRLPIPKEPKPMPALPLHNVWLGVSIEDQKTADERVPVLLATPAAIRFVSYEPALGPVDLTQINGWDGWSNGAWISQAIGGGIDLIIIGGESGPGARPFNMEWARSVIGQSSKAGVACFLKQLGSKPFKELFDEEHLGRYACRLRPDGKPQYILDREWIHLRDRKGGNMAEWPKDLRVREMPE